MVSGSTDAAVGPAVLKAAEAALSAATASSKKGGRGSSRHLVLNYVTVKGILPGVSTGAELQLYGDWEHHSTFGWQIK